MAKTSQKSQTEKLQMYEISLNNAESDNKIANLLSAAGYTPEVINEGNNLLTKAKNKFSKSITSFKQFRDAERHFIELKANYKKLFTDHRNRAKILFRTDASKKDSLFLKDRLLGKYAGWFSMAENFYSAINTQEAIKNAIEKAGVNQEQLDEANTMAEALKVAEFDKFKLKAISEDATVQKHEALKEITYWMRDFYAMAKIALKDRPQLLEALNKVVKS